MLKIAPILITGIPRSGTSIIASVVNQCGAFFGNTIKHDMMENSRIKNELAKRYFIDAKCDPRGQYPLPVTSELSIPLNWKKRVEQIMEEEGYKEGSWMYKSTAMSLMWLVWNYAYPNAKWIIVRRKPSDIIQSCLKTGYMNAYSDEGIRDEIKVDCETEGWKWWIREYEKKFIEMITEGLNCKIIWPERMVNGDYQQLHEVLDWVGLPWESEILNFIDPLLWKSKKERRIA